MNEARSIRINQPSGREILVGLLGAPNPCLPLEDFCKSQETIRGFMEMQNLRCWLAMAFLLQLPSSVKILRSQICNPHCLSRLIPHVRTAGKGKY